MSTQSDPKAGKEKKKMKVRRVLARHQSAS